MIVAAALAAVALTAAPVDLDQAKKAGAAAAESWVALLDAGNVAEAWKEAGHVFKSGVTSEDGTKKLKDVRGGLGTLSSRKLRSARYTEVMPGAPDGQYVVLTYASDFEKKKGATESVAVAHEADGQWRVSGYAVQ